MFELADIPAALFDRDLNLLRSNKPFIGSFNFSDEKICETRVDENLTMRTASTDLGSRRAFIALRPYFETLSQHTTQLSVDVDLHASGKLRLNFTFDLNNTLLLTLRKIQREECEQNLDKLECSLQIANSELAEFSHAIDHDLRSPMRAIRTIPDWINSDLESMLGTVPIEIQSHLTMLQKQANRMENMLEDLLAYTQIGHNQTKAPPVSLRAVLQQLQRDLPLPSGFRLEIPQQNNLIKVPEDELRLALRKLIENAFRHHHSQHAGRVVVEFTNTNGAFELRVIDDGPGIPKQYYKAALAVFSTLHSRDQQEGSGMGLSIANKIVRNWGGRLSIRSGAEQRGTCVALTLPADRCAT